MNSVWFLHVVLFYLFDSFVFSCWISYDACILLECVLWFRGWGWWGHRVGEILAMSSGNPSLVYANNRDADQPVVSV